MPPVSDEGQQSSGGADKPSLSLLKERRFKLSRACDRCRRRRIKCDEGHPCQACLGANSACTFEEPGKRSHPHKSKRTATLEDRMHHLESLIQAIPPAVFASVNLSNLHNNSNASGLPYPLQPVPQQAQQHPLIPGSGFDGGLSQAFDPQSQGQNPGQNPIYPSAAPPPALNVFPLVGPSTHFAPTPTPTPGAHGRGHGHGHGQSGSRQASPHDAYAGNSAYGMSAYGDPGLIPALGIGNANGNGFGNGFVANGMGTGMGVERLVEDTARLSLSSSYLYLDDEGYTRWQGEMSGLPILDLLVERHGPPHQQHGQDQGGDMQQMQMKMEREGSPASHSHSHSRSRERGRDSWASSSTSTSYASPTSPTSPTSPSASTSASATSPTALPQTSAASASAFAAAAAARAAASASAAEWFPDRTAKRTDIDPEKIWKLITAFIAPDLMDSLVQCYLSTSYYLMPFLHVPTFLNDYGNPQKWGEPGFAAFIVAVCCLASRHIDDPRVRADPSDGISSGTQWFELFSRLRTLPAADRPTVYTVQGVLVAGVYAVGWGKLSKAFALLSESITLSIDAGLHRSSDAYDIFDPIEDEIRRRTFWCVYVWDKQASAHFGRPPMIRLRDCDVGEPAAVDDEFITHEGIGPQPQDTPSRMGAFVCVLRLFVVLESVLDTPPPKSFGAGDAFLSRATSILVGFRRHKGLREEEALLEEACASVPVHWRRTPETAASADVIRVTHAERIACLAAFVRMLIMRHRFSEMVAERAEVGEMEQGEAECLAMRVAHACALQIVSAHLQIATKGLMTYYGVHVIHQLTQAGRTLVAFLLNCQADSLRPLIAPALNALRSCVGLLRRFSNRYVCGLRSGDLMEEFCRITQIPLDPPAVTVDFPQNNKTLPPWIRPVRKKTPSAPRSSGSQESPPQDSEAFSPTDMFVDLPTPNQNTTSSPAVPPLSFGPTSPSSSHHPHSHSQSQGQAHYGSVESALSMTPAEIMALFGGAGIGNDGGAAGLDMTALFHSQADFLGEGGMADAGLYEHAFGAGTGGSGKQRGSEDLSGLVATP